MKDKMIAMVSLDAIEDCIYFIRGQKVMLDTDLSALYGVSVKRLKEQVNRNKDRFPHDFLFRLSIEETETLFSSRSQFATLKQGRNIKYGSYAFSEQGVAMLSGVLHSPRAVHVNIAVMRTFARMRYLISSNHELAKKLEELERKLIGHDYQIGNILKAIRKLMMGARKSKPRIGYL